MHTLKKKAACSGQSVSQFSHSVVSNSLWPHESQHARPPCPSPTPGVHSDSRPLSQWCHPAISSSVVPLSSCPQSLPASESFPMSQLFAWGGQSTGVSALSIIPSKEIPGTIYRVPFIKDECMWQCAPQLDDTGLNSIFRQGHRSRSSAGQRLRLYSVIRQGHGLCSTVGKGWLGSLVG